MGTHTTHTHNTHKHTHTHIHTHNTHTHVHTQTHTLTSTTTPLPVSRSTNSQLLKKMGSLKALSSAVAAVPTLPQLHSELEVLASRLRLEMEAISRAVDMAQQCTESLADHLLPSS